MLKTYILTVWTGISFLSIIMLVLISSRYAEIGTVPEVLTADDWQRAVLSCGLFAGLVVSSTVLGFIEVLTGGWGD